MKLTPHDLGLETRKALVARMLRFQADAGSIEPAELLELQGRIEGARTRADLDAVQAELLHRLEA